MDELKYKTEQDITAARAALEAEAKISRDAINQRCDDIKHLVK